MSESRRREQWSRTSALMALIANANRDPKRSRIFRPSDFDPFARGGEKLIKVSAREMGALLAPSGAPKARSR